MKILKSNQLYTFYLKKLTLKFLFSAMILTVANDVYAQWIEWTTSQKQAIELLKAQWKLLPNIPTDYGYYGRRYPSGGYIYHTYPFGSDWQRYEADNLKNIDGKNIEIDNDIDSCMFLNETVYKANLSKIIPIIIDGRIDTARCTRWEYANVDRANSKDFTGQWLCVTGTAGTHMSMMADVLAAQKDNYTEEDYARANNTLSGTGEDVWVRPGKVKLYSMKPYPTWDITAFEEVFVSILDEATLHPDKKYILSCSRVGEIGNMARLFDKIGLCPNVIIITGRNLPSLDNAAMTFATHPATISVWYVVTPDLEQIDGDIQKLSFAGRQKDRVVPSSEQSPQTGKMDWDAFCVLWEWSTSQATAFMSGIVANLWNQNPSRTRDQIVAMLKRDVYKSSEYNYDANWFNERIWYGIAQPWKTMKENIFPEIRQQLKVSDGKYYFSVNNWPSTYRITWAIVEKDEQGYFVDAAKLIPGKYKVIFEGDCEYQNKTYTFPIDRTITIADPIGSAEVAQTQTLVYPNPATDQLFIQTSQSVKTIELRTLSGQVVLQQTGNQQTNISVSLAGLKGGVYLLRIEYQHGEKSQHKIIKNSSP